MKTIMNTSSIRRRLALSVGALLLLAGCHGTLTDSLLRAPDPDLINPADINNADGANGLRLGALSRLRDLTAGTESSWLFGGLLADEWSTSSTFIQNDEADERTITLSNSSVTAQFRTIMRARTAANQAIAALNTYAPTPSSNIAEMYLVRGFAELQAASDFCNGIPLTDASKPVIVYGQPLTVLQVFAAASASLDSAISFSSATDAATVRINTAAKIAKARAQVGLGNYAAAATLVSGIATTYSYDATFATSSGDNILWSQPFSQRRYSVGDSLEGNARNLPIANAIPFGSANDPRVPVAYTIQNGKDTVKAQDGFTFSRTTTLWAQSTTVPILSGVDARMVEAEAFLAAGNTASWLSTLNTIRATPPKLGTVTLTGSQLPALTDPGTAAARVNLTFREKAFWTFSRGQRLGDLRRLIRQYGRTPANTFPTGTHYRGPVYGADVNLPVPADELNNPNFKGCIDRNA